MATSSMVPSISQAPMGLSFDDIIQDDTPAVEIMIETPDDLVIGLDGLEIALIPEEEGDEPEFEANLAEFMDDLANERV